MGRPILLLRLEGPLQAWGLRSRWDVRDTGDEPSKSAIIGLLGCALGYSGQDPRLQELDEQLCLGVREEQPGIRLTDFQTVSGALPTADGVPAGSAEEPATIISPRTYLQDAAFLVGLAGEATVLEQCRNALRHPRWPIYLGRKSCPPSRPVMEGEGITDAYESLEDALRHYPWDWCGRTAAAGHPGKLRVVLEDPAGAGLRPDRVRVNPVRMYASRGVRIFWADFPGAVPLSTEGGGVGVSEPSAAESP